MAYAHVVIIGEVPNVSYGEGFVINAVMAVMGLLHLNAEIAKLMLT